jgi:transcriptional regulator with XRE-family HTH domain
VPESRLPQIICSEVAKSLREERERQGLSMNSVAQKAGLSQQMLSYVEREMRNPTLDTLLRIALVLKVDLGRVISKAEKHSSKRAVK